MRFLIDNALSPVVSRILQKSGHDSVHVRDYQMQAAPDVDILERARNEARVIVSADTDFGTLLAHNAQSAPSAILIRRIADRHPQKQAELLLANLEAFADDLDKGAVVVMDEKRIRVRRLPI